MSSLIISSCSFIDEPIYEVESELEPYLESFIHEANIRGVNINPGDLIIKFEGHLDNGRIGEASRNRNISRVNISKPLWQPLGSISKEMVMFHELGHLYIDFDHMDDHCCLMSTIPCIPNDRSTYNKDRESILDHLFGHLN